MKKVYWTTFDGRKVDVDEMDCQHLRNTLKMLLRKQEREKYKRKILEEYQAECDASEIDLY